MAMTRDVATEERIRRQLDGGAFPGPTELIAHALDLLEEEKAAEDWLDRNMEAINMEAINADIDQSFAQAARGETYSLEEAETRLAQRHVFRSA